MNEKVITIDIEKSILEYQELRPIYESFTEKAHSLIIELLHTADIQHQSIEHRTKTVKSFTEKIQREGKSYKKPLDDVTDLCGVRVILYTVEDVEQVCRLIEDEFDVDYENSIDKREGLKPHEFGYLSIHYIVKLSTERASLRENRNYADKKLEIQVRTVLQHAWAAIDHRLRYKSNTDAPEHLRRRLFLLSGLLEMADREFSELVIGSKRYSVHIQEKISENDLAIPIDFQSLQGYLTDSQTVVGVAQAARRAGLPEDEDEDDLNPIDLAEFRMETISDLAYFCRLTGLRTIHELDDLLISFEPRAKRLYRSIAQAFPKLRPSDAMVVIYAVWLCGARQPSVEDLTARDFADDFAVGILNIMETQRK